MSMTVGVVLALVLAVINRIFKLGLLSRLAERVTFVLIPPLVLIFLVLGTIFLGVATPTEGGAMGAIGALIMAIARRRLNMEADAAGAGHDDQAVVLRALHPDRLDGVQLVVPARSTATIWVEHLLTSLPGGQLGFLIVVNILVFVLAFFLDFFEIAFIVIPLLAPVADKMLGHRPRSGSACCSSR